MLSGNDSESAKSDDLFLPREILAQEKDIEAIFQSLIADSNIPPEVPEDQGTAWMCVVLLCCLSALGFWLMYLTSR
jgi:hypothetical protein